MKQPRVLVVGSINMDLVSYSKRIPQVGETVLGQRFIMAPGGKGANQALAAAKLGAKVTLLGAAGSDSYGDQLLGYLNKYNLDTGKVKRTSETTGVALINVDEMGNNQIVVVPGANFALLPEDLENQSQIFAEADVVVLQLEIPLDTISKAIDLANRFDKPLILNPAPAQILPEDWFNKIDYLVPNEHEVHQLGINLSQQYEELQSKLKGTLIVTLGENGVLYKTNSHSEIIPAKKVKVVDTTAAGDAFIGGLSVALAEGKLLPTAIRFAGAVAALSVTKEGAQTSLPYREEVEAFMGE